MSVSGQEPLVFANGTHRRFELTATLSAGSSANAKIVIWDGSALTEQTRGQFTVYDEFGIFSGVATNRGYCVWFADAKRWVIIQMEC